MPAAKGSYDAVAISLHWLIAIAILVNLGVGVWMHGAVESPATRAWAYEAFQLHKSIGLSILVLSLLRLAWRFVSPPPLLPAHMPGWERAAARITHWAFYGLMIGIPLSGWLYVSAQWRGDGPFTIPTLWFGLFEVPHLFGLHAASHELRGVLAGVAFGAHEWMAWGMVGLLVLHVGAALKHHWLDRDNVLAGMLPLLASRGTEGVPAQPASRRPLAAAATLGIAALCIAMATTNWLGPHDGAHAETAAARLQQIMTELDSPAPAWQLQAGSSEIGFSGKHAGRPFRGRFAQWQAAVHFDPQQLAQSRVVVVVETGSAATGVSLHNRTLPEAEWFNVARYPHAVYQSDNIRALDDNRYALQGMLTIKDRSIAVAPLTLTLDDDSLLANGHFELDRADFDLGMESDPLGEYVSRNIQIRIDARAERQP